MSKIKVEVDDEVLKDIAIYANSIINPYIHYDFNQLSMANEAIRENQDNASRINAIILDLRGDRAREAQSKIE